MRGDYPFQPQAATVTVAATTANQAIAIPLPGDHVLIDNSEGTTTVKFQFGRDNTVDVTTNFKGTVGAGKRDVFYAGPKNTFIGIKAGAAQNVYLTRGDGRL